MRLRLARSSRHGVARYFFSWLGGVSDKGKGRSVAVADVQYTFTDLLELCDELGVGLIALGADHGKGFGGLLPPVLGS